MKVKRQGFLSAKIRKTPKNPFNQKESNDNNKHKRSNPYNLSLNINNSNKEKIYGLISPKHKNINSSSNLYRSFSTNNMTSFQKKKTLGNISSKNNFTSVNKGSFRPSIFPSVLTHKSLAKSPSATNYFNKSRYFQIEDEKLSQEIYYLKNDIEKMNKKLYKLGKENKLKEKLLTKKENEINSIINKNNNITVEEILLYDNDDENYNSFCEEYNLDNENFNLKLIFKNISLKNYNYNNLFTRIRDQIIKTFKEIKKKEEEIENNKKCNYYTKMKEINIESSIYKRQINKINTLINNAMVLYDRNQKKLNEYELLENKIIEQEKLIKKINKQYENLQKEEFCIAGKIKKLKNVLDKKNLRKIKNFDLINTLKKKNFHLSKDKIIMSDYDDKAMNLKIRKLKKNIDLFKFHYRHTNNDINHLKEKRENLMKKQKIKHIPSSLQNQGNLILNRYKYTFNKNQNTLNQNIEELSTEYANKLKIQRYLEKLMKKYEIEYKKVINNNENNIKENNNDILINNENKIENNNENSNIINNKSGNNKNENDGDLDNIIDFRITEGNPFYTDEETNIPEMTNKFNNFQFRNFAYILFKNFESKNILLKESQIKIINPFLDIISQKNIKDIKYNNNSFNIIIDELTKIIMNLLDNTNKKNQKLISLFLGALLHNSNYKLSKLIDYINVLFSYTNDYSNEEEKYIINLQTKYKDQLESLYNILYQYICNNIYSQEQNNYIPLFTMKRIIEMNNIQLKDKYSEFLYYYMKKFYDPNSNLDDLDFDLLNNFFVLDSKDYNNKATTNSNKNESITEITNEEYEKKLKNAIDNIKRGLNRLNISFSEFIKKITYKAEIDSVSYECFNIENFDLLLKANDIILSELKLSCICNKYHITENLQVIDKNKIEKDIEKSI